LSDPYYVKLDQQYRVTLEYRYGRWIAPRLIPVPCQRQ
jgi:hypothetical protein